MIRFLFVLLLPLSLTSCSCGYAIFPDHLTINFDPPLTETGAYWIEVQGDFSGACEVQLPNHPACYGDLGLSGDETMIDGLEIERATPEEIILSISIDDVPLSTQTLRPTYDTDEPNGKGCGKRESAEIVVDPEG